MEYLKAPFIRFVLHEAIETGELHNVLDSCTRYWVEVLRRQDERQQMRQLVMAWDVVARHGKHSQDHGQKQL